MHTKIDHLVIGSASLEQGIEYVKDHLGVNMPYGGMHKKMGTHNHLMRLGHDVFLEIIAINHEIQPPSRPRWFGLDDALIRRHIERQPALLTWVVNTDNIRALKEIAGFCVGEIELIRRGDLSWYFGLPDDGRLLAGGMLPYAIEWLTDKHPAANMADLGCRLESLEIHHPHEFWLQSALRSIDAANLVEIIALPRNEAPYLKARIRTPHGIKAILSGTMPTAT